MVSVEVLCFTRKQCSMWESSGDVQRPPGLSPFWLIWMAQEVGTTRACAGHTVVLLQPDCTYLSMKMFKSIMICSQGSRADNKARVVSDV
jgi:hypothetical protein